MKQDRVCICVSENKCAHMYTCVYVSVCVGGRHNMVLLLEAQTGLEQGDLLAGRWVVLDCCRATVPNKRV